MDRHVELFKYARTLRAKLLWARKCEHVKSYSVRFLLIWVHYRVFAGAKYVSRYVLSNTVIFHNVVRLEQTKTKCRIVCFPMCAKHPGFTLYETTSGNSVGFQATYTFSTAIRVVLRVTLVRSTTSNSHKRCILFDIILFIIAQVEGKRTSRY